jgi:hypothetical protein
VGDWKLFLPLNTFFCFIKYFVRIFFLNNIWMVFLVKTFLVKKHICEDQGLVVNANINVVAVTLALLSVTKASHNFVYLNWTNVVLLLELNWTNWKLKWQCLTNLRTEVKFHRVKHTKSTVGKKLPTYGAYGGPKACDGHR